MLRNVIERSVLCHACNERGILLDEATRKELLADMEAKRKARADGYGAVYQSVNPVDFTVYFTADGNKATKWNQIIRLEDMRWLIKDTKTPKLEDKLRLALTGEVKVFCNCPDYLYGGFQYMGTQMDYNAGRPEDRFPHVRNPQLQGSICKHLYRVLFQLPMHYPMILSKLKGYWDSRL